MQMKKIENPKEKILVEISNSLQEAFDILGVYQFEVPPCPVVYTGDDREYMVKLNREWYYEYPHPKVGEAVGKLLIEHVSPDFLSQGSIYNFHELIGDYYLSEGNTKYALAMYDFAYHTIAPSNYADLKRWNLQLKMADILYTKMEGRQEDALQILKKVYEEVKQEMSSGSDTTLYLQYATALLAEVLETTEKGQGYEFLCSERSVFESKQPSFYLFCIELELAAKFLEYEDLCMYFLKMAQKHRTLLSGFTLVNEKYDQWLFSGTEREILHSDEIRTRLEKCRENLLILVLSRINLQ